MPVAMAAPEAAPREVKATEDIPIGDYDYKLDGTKNVRV